MPRYQRTALLCCLSIASLLTQAPTLHADDPKPEAAANVVSNWKGTVRQFKVQAADPIELAEILRVNYGVVATGSASTRMVVVTGEKNLDEIGVVVRDFEAAARERLAHEQVLAEAREVEERRRAENLAQQQANELAAKSIELDFVGGTVEQYLAEVRKSSGFDNIIIGSDTINELRMPPVRVKRITGTAAVLLLQNLRFSADGVMTSLSVDHVPGDPDATGIEADPVLIINRTVEETSKETSASTEVIDLSAYRSVQPKMVEALIDAVRSAVELQGPSPSFKLAVHQGTGLLFVRGNPTDLQLAMQTVEIFAARAVPDEQEGQ